MSNQTENRIKIGNLQKLFEADQYSDLKSLVKYSCEKYADSTAFIIKHKKGKEVSYEHVSFHNYYGLLKSFVNGLVEAGYKGKRMAIIGNNCMEWTIGYFGQLCGNGVVIPLDKGLPYEELASSLNRSYADVLLFDRAHLPLVKKIQESGECPNLEYIFMEGGAVGDARAAAVGLGFGSPKEITKEGEEYLTLEALIERGREAEGDFLEEYRVDPDETSIILFTSGTTSLAKAVQLTQRNVASNIYAVNICEDIRKGDVSMAFLPYHHTFGIMAQIVMISTGAITTYCEGLKYIQKNITEYKVSVFVCVPLLIESIYKKIVAGIKKQGLEKKVQTGIKISRLLLKFGIDVRRRLFKDVHEQLGGNLRFVISGASAIDPEALKGLSDFGIFAFQGYGMTETSPVLAAENHVENKAGSIGRALPGVELCIDEPNEEGIGELIARGPNVMKGYFENQEATDEILVDGWLHTGDLAYLDKDGYIFICGRKKNVIVLKNGKNVYPEELEVLIANLPYVEENMVYGEPKHHDGDENDLALVAKIVYKPEVMKDLYGLTDAEAMDCRIKTDIDAINSQVPVYKQLLRIHTTDQPMVKTTTGKVKRYAN